jgi:hypothetical protein
MAKRQLLVLLDKETKLEFKKKCMEQEIWMSDVVEVLVRKWLNNQR